MREVKRVPIGLEPGDTLRQPFGVFEIRDRRGSYDDTDTREWQIHDPETGETQWVDFEFLLDVTLATLDPTAPCNTEERYGATD